jgi:hypothetical protein
MGCDRADGGGETRERERERVGERVGGVLNEREREE